jgi:hypothetical protein
MEVADVCRREWESSKRESRQERKPFKKGEVVIKGGSRQKGKSLSWIKFVAVDFVAMDVARKESRRKV